MSVLRSSWALLSIIYKILTIPPTTRSKVSFERAPLLWFNQYMSKENNLPNRFERIALVGKLQGDAIGRILKEITEVLEDLGCHVSLEQETALHLGQSNLPALAITDFSGKIDMVISIGGDGTLIGVGRQIAGKNIPLVGINMGRLGYMTDIPLNEMSTILPGIIQGNFESDERFLLEASVIRNGVISHQGLALNDVVISRSSISGMVELAVDVNHSFMYNQRSDGLIVSTPTGSTAYSLSAGGPILHPRVFGIVLAPVAPHALSNRPIVLPGDALIGITIISGKDASVHFDMQSMAVLQTGDMVVVNKSSKTITILHPQGHSDYRTLREKLHWNEYPSSF